MVKIIKITQKGIRAEEVIDGKLYQATSAYRDPHSALYYRNKKWKVGDVVEGYISFKTDRYGNVLTVLNI